MTTKSPITDIHAAEQKAKKHIEDAKRKDDKKIADTKEKEEAKLLELEEKLRTGGKESFATAKKAAAEKADSRLKTGKSDNKGMMKVAQGKIDSAVEKASSAFTEYTQQ